MCPVFPRQAQNHALYLLLPWAPGSESQNARRRRHSRGLAPLHPSIFPRCLCLGSSSSFTFEAGSSAVVLVLGSFRAFKCIVFLYKPPRSIPVACIPRTLTGTVGNDTRRVGGFAPSFFIKTRCRFSLSHYAHALSHLP